MAKFELNYDQTLGYSNKVIVNIALETRPTKVEYQDMLDAIETLHKISQKYLVVDKKQGTDKK